jgi:hypothetical protein
MLGGGRLFIMDMGRDERLDHFSSFVVVESSSVSMTTRRKAPPPAVAVYQW